MGTQANQTSGTEQERQQRINEMKATLGDHWSEQYEPGSFGCYELLDRTSLAGDIVEQYVLSHPACVQNKDWFELAFGAVSALRDLYQQVGAAPLDSKRDAAGDS